MHTIDIDNITLEVPSTWDELSKKQIFWLAKNFEELLKPNYSFQLRFLLKLLNIGFFSVKAQRALLNISTLQIKCLSDITEDFLPVHTLNLRKNPLPSIFTLKNRLYGPQDALVNCTLAEFSFADMYFQLFMKNQEEEDLNKLIATLYRKRRAKKTPMDIRVPFDSFSLKNDIQSIKKIAIYKKIAILLYYWGTRNHFNTLFPNVFATSEELERTTMSNSWIDLTFELSGPKFGTIQETENSLIYEVLSFLEKEIIKNKKNRKHGK